MSRVRDVLRKVEVQGWTETPSLAAQREIRETGVHSRPLLNPLMQREQPVAILPHRMTDSAAPPIDTAIVDTFDLPLPGRPSVFARWIRRTRRFLGLRVGPAPRCAGFTRHGLPCRGPAMANGLCRVHGGSRIRSARAEIVSA